MIPCTPESREESCIPGGDSSNARPGKQPVTAFPAFCYTGRFYGTERHCAPP